MDLIPKKSHTIKKKNNQNAFICMKTISKKKKKTIKQKNVNKTNKTKHNHKNNINFTIIMRFFAPKKTHNNFEFHNYYAFFLLLKKNFFFFFFFFFF